jgi:hypothetical protein
MAEKTNSSGAATRSGGMTKIEGVRLALAELGPDAKPLRIQAFVKERFGIDISTEVVSAYKKELARRGGKARGRRKGKGRGRKAGARRKSAAPGPSAQPATEVRAAATGGGDGKGGGISLGDLRVVKDLVKRVGASQLRDLIDILGR